MNNVRVTRPYRKRRQYTPEFKAQLVAESQNSEASVARIALDNDLNANLLRRWITESKQANQQLAPAFVSINLPATATPSLQKSSVIRIEIPQLSGPIVVEWPAEQAQQCALFLAHVAAMIRMNEVWLATEPLDMRAGPDTALARVVQVFGSARPHCAYLFANKRGNRMKVLIHDGLGIWLCARRLNKGKFHWGETWRGKQLQLDDEQLAALVQGLPWQRLGAAGVISVL